MNLDFKPFTRPRRFGKTLNMSMIYYFFNKSSNSMAYLFEGKNIWICGEEYTQYQGKFPMGVATYKISDSLPQE